MKANLRLSSTIVLNPTCNSETTDPERNAPDLGHHSGVYRDFVDPFVSRNFGLRHPEVTENIAVYAGNCCL